MPKKLRALVIAEAANPEWVSVPLVGWSIAQALRDVADVHLVTQIRNRDAILRIGLTEKDDFTAIDSEALVAPLWKIAEKIRMGKGVGWTTTTAIMALGYGYFERLVWRHFGAAIQRGDYDIVHRITPLTPTANSSLAAKCARANVPFILGPLNGGVPWPSGFNSERRREKEWLSYIRSAYKLQPGRNIMLSAASAIICGSRFTLSEVPARYQHKTVWLPENAIDPSRFNLTAQFRSDLPLRACFIGRLVPYKGADMAVLAMSDLLREGKMTLDVIGDGPQRADLDALVAREGVTNGVHFHGWLDHTSVQKVAAECQLLTFPSVREFGGGVVLEAMALGVVPVVVDYGGPGELVDEQVGFKVPIGSREEVIVALREVLTAIAANPEQLQLMAEHGQNRVFSDFTWEAKAWQIEKIWRAVLAGQSPLPTVLPTSGSD